MCSFLAALDPFQEPERGGGGTVVQEGYIHIRIQQRNGRKTLTTVQGIAEAYDKKKIAKVCKKVSSVPTRWCTSCARLFVSSS